MQKITGVILAGGRATRLRGADKALLSIAGKPLIAYIIAILQPQVDDILINVNKNKDAYTDYGYTIISDQIKNYVGPLAGIVSAILATNSEYILSVPCDCPAPPSDLAKRLLGALLNQQAMVATAHDGTRLQPLFTLFNRALAENIINYLASGKRQVANWIESQNTIVVDFSDQSARFTNINTPEEYAIFEKGFIKK